MKEVKELTMLDFFKHTKMAMFNLSMRKDFADSRVYTYLRWFIEDKQVLDKGFLCLWDIYKEVFPGLKRKEMLVVWNKWNDLRSKRFSNRRSNLDLRHTCLSKDQYNAWAGRVWKKRGSPRFHKRIITGVVFGHPYNSIWKKRNTIAYRYVGVEIEDGVRIKISIVK